MNYGQPSNGFAAADMLPTMDVTKEDEYPAGLTEETHNKLLAYLQHRLQDGNTNRGIRLIRFAQIDRDVSTWQQLSMADSERQIKHEATGQAVAVNMNLPLLHTHMEDMVSFFSAIYSPTAGDFLSVPDPAIAEQGKSLIEKLNGDAKQGKYFKNLCAMLRSIMKYNVSGFALDWVTPAADMPDDKGRNVACAIDMYNFIWDTSVDDPSEIPEKAEWAARFYTANRLDLIKGDGDEYIGISPIIDGETNGPQAKYFRYPPNQAGLQALDQKTTRSDAMDWNKFNASLATDAHIPLKNSYEVVEMYCWVNPGDFLLEGVSKGSAEYKDELCLYKFKILNDQRVVYADRQMVGDQDMKTIPYYVGYLNQDDMGSEQRSQAELMAPFQNYGSFLINADVAGTRGSIWGIQAFDPTMFNLGALPQGATSGRIPSTAPGRDVRSGLQTLNGEYDTGKTMEKLAAVMQMVQQFFPSQALPNQVAGIDRAINSQVAAVMQGVSRRLHMLVRIVDDDIMGPLRMAEAVNIAANQAADNLAGMTDAQMRQILGSGLQQLNREAAAQAMQQLLFAIIQNPQSAQQMDVLALMDFWGSLLDMSVDLQKFRVQPQVDAQGNPINPAKPGGTVASPPPPQGS